MDRLKWCHAPIGFASNWLLVLWDAAGAWKQTETAMTLGGAFVTRWPVYGQVIGSRELSLEGTTQMAANCGQKDGGVGKRIDRKMGRGDPKGPDPLGRLLTWIPRSQRSPPIFLSPIFLSHFRCENEKSPLPTRDDVSGEGFDTPGRIRTCNPRFRRPMRYPVVPRVRVLRLRTYFA